jgi:hypothetical protein
VLDLKYESSVLNCEQEAHLRPPKFTSQRYWNNAGTNKCLESKKKRIRTIYFASKTMLADKYQKPSLIFTLLTLTL